MTTPPAGSVEAQFGAVAREYASSAVHAGGPDLDALLAAAALSGSERALDLGSGAGHTALAVAPRAASVIGIDVTPEMVEVATGLARERGIANAEFRLGDVAALPFPGASFDVVTSRYSAHHYPDPARALGEVRRVLRPGGSFLLVDTVVPEDAALDTFENAVELLRDPSHVRNWRVSEWLAMLASAGLAGEVTYAATIDLDGDAWTARMRTPPEKVAMIRSLFESPTEAQREAFSLRRGPWGWTIPVVLLRATHRA